MPSILDGVDKIVDRFFGLEEFGKSTPHYSHKSSCIHLSKNPPSNPNGRDLLQGMYNRILVNWDKYKNTHNTQPSSENWRFEKIPYIGDENPSPEVGLERSIIKIADKMWANQVSTSSGLAGPHFDKRRAIDLVFKRDEREFEFIELKIAADTPLYAAIEVVGYGLLYIFSRNNADELGYSNTDKEILGASHIHLSVLAPADYYSEYEVGWLEVMINDSARHLISSEDLNMDFEFKCLPESFSKNMKKIGDEQVLEAIKVFEFRS